MCSKKIIIIAGGSGGHVFPAITIANCLIKNGWNVNWIGMKNKIESDIVPKYNIKIHFIHVHGLRNANLKTLICAPINILKAYLKVKKIINSYLPNIILGMGGYVSGPGGLAAWTSNIPFILHEQNKIPGVTNRLLSKISTKNMQAFAGSLLNAEVVGNPIREDIIKIPSPTQRFKNRSGPLRVLIIGGSQGASILNNILPKVLFFLKKQVIIWHQSGENEFEQTKKKYKKYANHKYRINSFIENIASAYEWADIIISRSGALTVSEITTVGLGAIFIPYPHKDQQQLLNALDLKKNGAAKIIEQSALNTQVIARILNSLDREKLLIMAQKAFSLRFRESTMKIFQIIKKIAKK